MAGPDSSTLGLHKQRLNKDARRQLDRLHQKMDGSRNDKENTRHLKTKQNHTTAPVTSRVTESPLLLCHHLQTTVDILMTF